MMIGSNPRKEAPVLNARIRKRWLQGGVLLGMIGENVDLTYQYNQLGAGPDSLKQFIDHAPANKNKPMFIVGQGALCRDDSEAILAMIAKSAQSLGVVKDGWNGFNVLHTAAARVGALDIGFVPGEGGMDALAMAKGGVDILFNLGADEIEIAPGAFVIYQGSHGDRGAHRADVILPGAAYTEKSGTYVNTEGRVQIASRASFPPGDAREDWAILRALSAVLGKALPYDSLTQLRAALYKLHPHLSHVDGIESGNPADLSKLAGLPGTPVNAPFVNAVKDFYLTNPVARASAVMAECSALASGRMQQAAE